jgi:hypothetical protein
MLANVKCEARNRVRKEELNVSREKCVPCVQLSGLTVAVLTLAVLVVTGSCRGFFRCFRDLRVLDEGGSFLFILYGRTKETMNYTGCTMRHGNLPEEIAVGKHLWELEDSLLLRINWQPVCRGERFIVIKLERHDGTLYGNSRW